MSPFLILSKNALIVLAVAYVGYPPVLYNVY